MFSANRCMAVLSLVFGYLCWLPVFVLGLPFLVVGLIANGLKWIISTFSPKPVPWQQLIEYMPEIGWKPKANLDTHVQVDGVYRLTTDDQGWRGKRRIEESDVVVFGDSYAFGYGVSDQDFFASISNGLRIKAIGVNGYNMVQELLWMRRFSRKLDGKLVIWFIYHGNDLLENLTPNLQQYRMPFLRFHPSEKKWEIVNDHVSRAPWTVSQKRNYHKILASFCRPSAPDRIFDACSFLIREGKTICEKAGAQLVVMSIPDATQIDPARARSLKVHIPLGETFDPDYPDQRIKKVCDDLSVPFLTLKKYLTADAHKAKDAHWNAKGHRQVASAIEQVYREQRILPVGAQKDSPPAFASSTG
jgi:hypothetical protein